jgi:hypothetical protein
MPNESSRRLRVNKWIISSVQRLVVCQFARRCATATSDSAMDLSTTSPEG